MTDVRFALRTLARRPGFAIIAVLTLALGIGASTAVFSVVDAVLLRPLPYKNPGRLAAIWLTSTREKSLAKIFAVYGDYREFARSSRTLQSVGAATWAVGPGRVLTGYGPSRPLLTIPATVSFFQALGVPAALGRTFRSEDESRGCSVLLAHRFWTSTLGASPSIIGKSLTLDNKPCTILGVMPQPFGFYPRDTDAWILLGPGFQKDQDHIAVGIFGRLKPGVSLAQVQAELRSLYRAIHRDVETRDFEPVVYDLHGEFTFLAGRNLRTTLILLFAAVLLVLLIACLNVANLLLARLSDRRRELAVRAALGSGEGRLVRQLLTEGLLLAGCGSVLGLAIAWLAVRYFRSANPIELSVGADVRINLPVLAFSIALSFATTLVFALLPAIRASRVDLIQHLKTGGRGSVAGRQSIAKAVVAFEMALSFLLLIGAGLFLTSALRMGSEPLGFNPERVLSARISLPQAHYPTTAQRTVAYDRLLERLEQMPGAAAVALSSKLPPNAGGNQTLEIQGRPVSKGSEIHDTGADAVSPAFFDVLHIPLLRGRAFRVSDRENSQSVALINQALAEKYFPHSDPIGRQIRIAGGPMPWLTIVGIVGNLKHTQLMNEMQWVATPIFYRPLAQDPRPSVEIVVRAAGNATSLEPELERQVAAVDPSIPLSQIESLTSRLATTLAYPRFRAVIFTLFALGALLLSAVGLHGVLSQLVAQRIPEFGVRRAVGAQTTDLVWLIARQGGVPVLTGLALGICATVVSGRVLANLLYGIHPADPAALLIVSLVLLAVAALAITLPAARAARIDPMVALREE